ncbi:MAG: apolipoprotein N-acyltransferase [Deltaproteobacteria bacterium]|nr:apolipoprotein N-acyltransferase [Deltaproteobacteria bacterium]
MSYKINESIHALGLSLFDEIGNLQQNVGMKFVLSAIIAGICFGAGCQFPETAMAVTCTVITALLLVYIAAEDVSPTKRLYIFGLVFSLVAFYWIPQTLQYFGGFPRWLSYLLFAVYCLLSSLQFVLCAYLLKKLKPTLLGRWQVAFPLAWLITEMFWPRLFPWNFAHPLISWTSFSALAEVTGVYPLSFLIFWWASVMLSVGQKKLSYRDKKVLFPLCLFVIVSLGGHWRSRYFVQLEQSLPLAKIGIVQGNLEAVEKNDLKLFSANIKTYQDLSTKVLAAGAEILVWPEAVINHWTPVEAKNVRGYKFDPFPSLQTPLIYGAMAYQRKDSESKDSDYYNSAIGLDAQGNILGLYHKRILMPFGEYMPFAQWLPQLKDLSPQTGDFTAGDKVGVLSLPLEEDGRSVKAGLLICYEDLIPSLARNSALAGADVLVNLTNDAWYGHSAASEQHHLLAMWRAIETRRYLLRVTNTGYTGVVNVFGRTVESLPIFTSGIILASIRQYSLQTFYTLYGNLVSWLIILILLPISLKKIKER